MQNFNVFVRTLALIGLVAIGGWWTFFLRGEIEEHELALEERDQKIEKLSDEVAAKVERIRQLELRLALLKVDHRVARVEVLDQVPLPGKPERVRTTIRFTELDADGASLGDPREMTIEGKTLYLDALVIKFEDDYVERGDFLRGTSIGLFRRAFGEEQKPSDGVPIDAAGLHPLPYAGDELPDPFYTELWERFWDYANDPALAREKGVRAMQGEAPYMELRPGKSYKVELRSSGGLSIRAE